MSDILASRFIPTAVAGLVLFHCWALGYSPQDPASFKGAQLPKSYTENISETRGWPFFHHFSEQERVNGYLSIEHNLVYRPGAIANLSVAILNCIATFCIFEYLRRKRFQPSVSLEVLLATVTAAAVTFAIWANMELIETKLLPALGLLIASNLPDFQSISFFALGLSCSIMTIGFCIVRMARTLADTIHRQLT